MGGFVSAFASSLAEKQAPGATDPEVLKAVMGYLTPAQLPVYDHLARNFCVCDHWHCSIPGPTLPNRFYALAGTTNGVLGNIDVIVGEFGKFKSFFRYLDRDAWRWYSSDPGVLRAVDEQYSFDNDLDRFAYFDQATEVQERSFLTDVLEDGELPAVAWIDPNFNMGKMIPDIPFVFDGPGSNDDHPPAPVLAGQKLVNKIYTALGRSPYWDTTLFVVMYDEHGGFFDHVPPPGKLGPRTPALLISPHVKRGVCHTQFDHASVIRTILVRFGARGSLEQMPASVRAAEDFSVAHAGRRRARRVHRSARPGPGEDHRQGSRAGAPGGGRLHDRPRSPLRRLGADRPPARHRARDRDPAPDRLEDPAARARARVPEAARPPARPDSQTPVGASAPLAR